MARKYIRITLNQEDHARLIVAHRKYEIETGVSISEGSFVSGVIRNHISPSCVMADTDKGISYANCFDTGLYASAGPNGHGYGMIATESGVDRMPEAFFDDFCQLMGIKRGDGDREAMKAWFANQEERAKERNALVKASKSLAE